MKVLRDSTAHWMITTLRRLESQLPSIHSGRGARPGQEWLVPFELTESLGLGGSGNAKLLRLNGVTGEFEPDDDSVVTVHDDLGLGFAAPAGARGIAVCLGAADFQIVAIANVGPRNFKLTSALVRGGSANAEFVDALGNGTGETVRVYDHPLGIFFGAIGTPGIAAYDSSMGRWQVIAIGCSES